MVHTTRLTAAQEKLLLLQLARIGAALHSRSDLLGKVAAFADRMESKARLVGHLGPLGVIPQNAGEARAASVFPPGCRWVTHLDLSGPGFQEYTDFPHECFSRMVVKLGESPIPGRKQGMRLSPDDEVVMIRPSSLLRIGSLDEIILEESLRLASVLGLHRAPGVVCARLANLAYQHKKRVMYILPHRGGAWVVFKYRGQVCVGEVHDAECRVPPDAILVFIRPHMPKQEYSVEV